MVYPYEIFWSVRLLLLFVWPNIVKRLTHKGGLSLSLNKNEIIVIFWLLLL